MQHRKIKVAFFAEILIDDFDGAARTMFQLIHRIPHQQFEFLFICGNGPETIGGFECLRIPKMHLPINPNYTMALPMLVGRRLKQKLAAFQPDVIHIATPSPLGNFAVKYANKHQIPAITIYHTHFISYIDYYLKRAPFLIGPVKARVAASQSAFYNKCQKIYVPTTVMAQELSNMGVQQKGMKIWKRGIDTELFHPQKRNTAAMQKLCGNNRPVVLFASRLVWEKNLETLIRIYEKMQTNAEPYNLVVAGDGAAMTDAQKRMPKAIFTGAVPHNELAVLYASADVFLFTSISETYGNVVMEAMASGAPCVIAKGGGSQELVQHETNGYLCAPVDEDEYISRINELMQQPELRRQMGEKGRAFSLLNNWDALAAEYFNDLQALSNKPLNTSSHP